MPLHTLIQRAAPAALLTCALALMPPAAVAGEAMDSDGRMVRVDSPERIISLGGPVSEIVAGLGRTGQVIAVDSTTAFPPAFADLPRVGYLRALGAEGLLSAAPHLIVAQNDAGPPRVLEQVEAAGVPVLRLPPADSLGSLETAIHRLAALLDVPEAGDAMIAALRVETARLPGTPAHDAPEVMFILSGHGGAPMAAGRDTPIHALFELAGLRNAFASVSGWKPVSAEALAGAAPQGLIISERSRDADGGVEGFLSHPALAPVTALRDARILSLDPTLLQGLGPRSPQAARTLAEAFGTLPSADQERPVEEARR